MRRETRKVYSGQGNLVNVRLLWSLQSRWRQGERCQFHHALYMNDVHIRAIRGIPEKHRTQALREELAMRLKHQEIFDEYCRLDKRNIVPPRPTGKKPAIRNQGV